jgi:CubicO group peptidase (beta-lactamase class C family)
VTSQVDQRAAQTLSDLVGQTSSIPVFAATIMIGGRIVLEHNAGKQLPACSTFKVAAASAVMDLVQEGIVTLDEPIGRNDPSLVFSDPVAAQNITLRHLLSHTSGLDDTDELESRPWEALPHLRFAAEPGRAFRYSNVGFDIAILTAARQTGLSGQDFLRTHVLDPLGMKDSRWVHGFASGTPVTTAHDLMQLASEHLSGGRILRPQALAEMHRVHADSYTAGPCRYYGLGICVEEWAERTLLAHGGGLYPYGTAFVIDPAARAAVALLFDNPAGYGISPQRLLDRILDRQTATRPARPDTTAWTPYLGRYTNGAELASACGQLLVRWKNKEHLLSAVDDRLFASGGGVSVGLLPGQPRMISVNDFILIGATPGLQLEPDKH